MRIPFFFNILLRLYHLMLALFVPLIIHLGFSFCRNAFRYELTLLEKVRHPNVVQFVGAVTQNIPMMILLEYSRVRTYISFIFLLYTHKIFFFPAFLWCHIIVKKYYFLELVQLIHFLRISDPNRTTLLSGSTAEAKL